jgi:ribonuclease G
MKKEIFINATLNEIRVAITENGRLAELFWELPENGRHVGNIYLGRVQRIVQGMNAAFVDIGLKQDAFLHFSDVGDLDDDDDDDDTADVLAATADDESAMASSTPSTPQPQKTPTKPEESLTELAAIALRRKVTTGNVPLPTFSTKRSGNVTINLEYGQPVMVQVTREAYGSKGLRVTTKISLAGRYLVLLPFGSSVGVSKKIWNVKERRRLRGIAKSLLPDGIGCIVRTEAQEQSDERLRNDVLDLLAKWRAIEDKIKQIPVPEAKKDHDGKESKGAQHTRKGKKGGAKTDKQSEKKADKSQTDQQQEQPVQPMLLHRDMTMAQSLIRDLLTADVQHVTVDSKKLYADIKAYTEWASPHLANRIRLYEGKSTMFAAYGLVEDIRRSYSRIVGLPSGGYLVWDHTEAMTVVDVNSGRFAPDRDQEANALRTNIEAVREIARQLRVRDIGGMIVVDCIDMQDERNKRKLVEAMHQEIKNDRTQVVLYPITQLGLLQITRSRVRQNISQIVHEPCPTCGGTGVIRSRSAVISSIERWLRNFTHYYQEHNDLSQPLPEREGVHVHNGHHNPRPPQQSQRLRVSPRREFKLVLRVHPHLASSLTEGTVSKLARLMIKFFVKIQLEQDETLAVDEYRFISVRRQRDITNEYYF